MILQKTLFLEFRGHHCPSRAGFIRGKIRREILPGGAIPAKSHKLLFRFRYYVSQRKRSTRYVNSLLQGHMMWRMATYWMIYNGALIGVIAGEKLMRFIPDMIAGKSAFSFGEFISQFASESRVLIVAMLVFCPLLIWDMLKFSHRIAGPIYRFSCAM